MQPLEESVQTLVNLGLTVLQAKVYITLAKFGVSTGRATAKGARVASQDVYRVLHELEEKGLVEKIISKPTMHQSIPIKEGLHVLLQNKRDEYRETEKQAKMMLNSFCENGKQNILDENIQFIISYEMSQLFRIHDKLAEATQTSIDFIFPLKLNKTLFDNSPYIKRAIKRGVKIRLITLGSNEEASAEVPKSLVKNRLFEFKNVTESACLFGMHIFDKKEVTLAISEQNAMPSLWTKNPHLLRLAEVYFENLWNSTQ